MKLIFFRKYTENRVFGRRRHETESNDDSDEILKMWNREFRIEEKYFNQNKESLNITEIRICSIYSVNVTRFQ